MLAWQRNSELYYEIDSQDGDQETALKESRQTLEIHGVHRFWKERPAWMRTVYSGKEGESIDLLNNHRGIILYEHSTHCLETLIYELNFILFTYAVVSYSEMDECLAYDVLIYKSSILPS